jgi:hypothetical protein
MSTVFYYFPDRSDGFGAQFQTLVYSILFCECNNANFLYRGIKNIEHNYDNDSNYINEIDELMNIKNNYNYEKTMNRPDNFKMVELPFNNLIKIFDRNTDFFLSCLALTKLKNVFWQNKNKNVYNTGKTNIAVHIRRYCTSFDIGCSRQDVPLVQYLNIMNSIRAKYKNNLLFHIYSIGDSEYFKELENHDVILHINENISKTFTELVGADILVTSRSSFSYVAAILSDAIVYYKEFWHPPSKKWILW